MNPEPTTPVTEDELWFSCADADVRHADVGKPSAEIARHYSGSADAHRPLIASELTISTCATRHAVVGTAPTWALLIEAAIGRGGEHALYVDRVQVLDPGGTDRPSASDAGYARVEVHRFPGSGARP